MSRRRRSSNPKRKIRDLPVEGLDLDDLASRASYGGNPEHKRNPGDFLLIPPSSARRDKTLCDDARVFRRDEATRLVLAGLRRGLVSVQTRNGWPQNIWAVGENDVPLEA